MTTEGGDRQIIQNATRLCTKSTSTWILYLIVGVFPIVTALIALIAVVKNCYTDKCIELPPIKKDYVVNAVPFFILAIVLEIIVSTIIIYWKKLESNHYYRLNDSVNSIFMGMFQQLVGAFAKALSIFPYYYIHQNFHYTKLINWVLNQGVSNYSPELHSSLQYLADKAITESDEVDYTHVSWWVMFLLIEFGYYWMHRFSHEWNAMWAGHIVHHSSEEYNLTTALRQGLMQQLLSWGFYIWGAPFFPMKLYIFHANFNLLYQFWIHTRVIGKLPFFIEWIFNTPSHHRVHHGRNAKYIDKNYGGTLIIYDRLFGTFQPEEEEAYYGISYALPTWNPFYAQFHHLFEILDVSRRMPTLWLKMRVWLDYGPYFNYLILHPNSTEPEKGVKMERRRYDVTMPNLAMSFYGFVHSAMLIVFTSLLMANHTMSGTAKFLFSALQVFGMFSISALFDQKSYAKGLELFRIMVLFPIFGFAALALILNEHSLVNVLDSAVHQRFGLVISGVVVTVLSFLVVTFKYRLPKQKAQ